MDFRGLAISTLLIGLFVFAMISFGTTLQLTNNANSTIASNEVINRSFTDMQTELEGVQAGREAERESWFRTIPVIGEISVILETIVAVGAGLITVIGSIFNITIELISVGLGIGSGSAKVVFGVFTAIIIFSGILLAWSVYRSGK